MENTCRRAFFGKVADPQPAILSKKCSPLQISFNWFVYISVHFRPQRKKVPILKLIVC